MKSLSTLLLGTMLGGAVASASLVYKYPFLIEVIAQDIAQAREHAQHPGGIYAGADDTVIARAPDRPVSPPRRDPVPSPSRAPEPMTAVAPPPKEAPKPAGSAFAASPFAEISLPAPLEPTCALPQPNAGTRTIAVGTYQGRKTNTDVTFDGAANGSAPWLVDVEVAAGNEPLWLVMSAFEPVIWNFQGDMDRIEHVVLVDGVSSAGAMGLPEGRVTAMGKDCFTGTRGPVYFTEIAKSWQVLGTIEATIGAEMDDIFAQYDLDRVALPEGVLSQARRDAFTDTPDLHHVDPSNLVLTAVGKRPDLMPGPIGISQLIQSGALRKKSGYESYEILSYIPALPTGARGEFTLAKDVAPPEQIPFMLCVMDWRGKPVEHTGSTCR